MVSKLRDIISNRNIAAEAEKLRVLDESCEVGTSYLSKSYNCYFKILEKCSDNICYGTVLLVDSATKQFKSNTITLLRGAYLRPYLLGSEVVSIEEFEKRIHQILEGK